MKIAIVTDDGDYVNQHFGRARYYKIFTVEDGRITGSEMREKTIGHHGAHGHEHHHHHEHHSGEGRGFGSQAQSRHDAMAEQISDCQVLIAGGMGRGAYQNFRAKGIEVFVTDYESVEEAATAYAEGKLTDLYESRTH